MGVQIPEGEGALLGVVRPLDKHWETLLRCTQKLLNRLRCGLGGADSCNFFHQSTSIVANVVNFIRPTTVASLSHRASTFVYNIRS